MTLPSAAVASLYMYGPAFTIMLKIAGESDSEANPDGGTAD
jgi:hypothetical protein